MVKVGFDRIVMVLAGRTGQSEGRIFKETDRMEVGVEFV
jgi:hypothetical protein